MGEIRKGWVVMALTIRYLVSTRRGIMTLALAWVPLLLTGALALSRVPSFDMLLYEGLMVPLFLRIVVIFVTLVSAMALVREEIDDNTLPFLLTRPVSKTTVIVSKYAGYLAAALALLLPPVVVSWGVTEAYHTGASTDLNVLGGFLAATAIGVVAYGALFYFLSVALRKPLMVGLLMGFLWEAVIIVMPGSIPKLSLIYYLQSILVGVIPGYAIPGFTPISAAAAVAVLVVFALVMLALSAFLFQSMEFRQKA